MGVISVILLIAAGDILVMNALGCNGRKKQGFALWVVLRLAILAFIVYLTNEMETFHAEGPLSFDQAGLDAFDGEFRGLAVGIGLLTMFAIAQSLVSLLFLLIHRQTKHTEAACC